MKNIIWFIISIFLQLYFCKDGEYVLYFSHYPQVQPQEHITLSSLMRHQIITNICIGEDDCSNSSGNQCNKGIDNTFTCSFTPRLKEKNKTLNYFLTKKTHSH